MRYFLPETAFSFEYTLVPANGNVHDPIVQVATQGLSDKDGNLESYRRSLVLKAKLVYAKTLTIGVPYAPAVANWLNPNPTGGGDPRNTALVTCSDLLER